MHRVRASGAAAAADRQILVLLEGMSSAIFSLSIEALARRKGRNLIQVAAYLSGLRLKLWKLCRTYGRKSTEDVRGFELVGTALSPEEFFNRSEQAERRVDANVGRHMIVALPRYDTAEPTADTPRAADVEKRGCSEEEDTRRMMTILRQMALFLGHLLGVPVFFAYHRPVPGSAKPDNPHGHFIFGPRPWDEATQTFARTRFRALDAAKTGGPLIELIRLRWEEIINANLEPGMKPVCRLSHTRKGDGLIAKRHLGYRVCAAERKKPGSTRTAEFNLLLDRRAKLANEIEQLGQEVSLFDAEIAQLAAEDLAPLDAAASRSQAAEAVLPDELAPVSAAANRERAAAALGRSEVGPQQPGEVPVGAAAGADAPPENDGPLAPLTADQSRMQAAFAATRDALAPLHSTQSRALAAKNAQSALVHPMTAEASRQQARTLTGRSGDEPVIKGGKALLPDAATAGGSVQSTEPTPDPGVEADVLQKPNPAPPQPLLSLDELRANLGNDGR